MEIALGLIPGLVLGALFTYLWIKFQKDPEKSNAGTSSSRNQLLKLIQSLPDIVIWVDGDNRIKYASEVALSLNIARDEKIQIDSLESLISTARKVDEPITKKIKAKRPLGIAKLNLDTWVMRLERGEVLLWAQNNSIVSRVETVRRDFVANISHELKTPVGALSLLAEAIEEAGKDSETIQKFAKRIGPETKRLTNVIRDIIDLSQVQSDDPLATASPVEVDRVINDAIDAVQLLADLHSIEIVQVKSPDVKIMGDEYQLVMAVRNLLSNAITFSPASSRITVGAKLKDGVVEITVSDQGIGISLENQSRIFERFYRVDPARSRSTGGTGLGLAIVKHVCENHGGEVSVWSVQGQGSTFTMKFPQMEEEALIETKKEFSS
ncbi:MAG: sensor histidine kinase [Actinomycetes bacterium]|jgi:two-component system sensor histidine kinase SenX3